MAHNDQSKIRYDDFIGKVQSDPANPQATIMLAGFTGKGPDGHVRIYPDPTLGKWYDVPEADVVHSQPIANSDLGGSYVWIKRSAQIKPGGELNPQPLPPAAQFPLQPTPATHCFVCPELAAQQLPTPATHCFICPPLTQVWLCQQQTHQVHCPSAPVVCDTMPQTHQLHCRTAPVVCDTMPQTHQVHCPTAPVVCDTIVRTNLPQCGIVAPTAACGGQQQMPQAQAQAFQPTPSAVQHCGGFTQNICGPQPQPFSQHICPTPSAVQQCGQPFTQHICPTPSAVFQCGGLTQHFTQCICPTPTLTANIACLQTANTPCFPITLAGCTPQSIACTPNGVFNPFGR
jgi:hypothetical protein